MSWGQGSECWVCLFHPEARSYFGFRASHHVFCVSGIYHLVNSRASPLIQFGVLRNQICTTKAPKLNCVMFFLTVVELLLKGSSSAAWNLRRPEMSQRFGYRSFGYRSFGYRSFGYRSSAVHFRSCMENPRVQTENTAVYGQASNVKGRAAPNLFDREAGCCLSLILSLSLALCIYICKYSYVYIHIYIYIYIYIYICVYTFI